MSLQHLILLRHGKAEERSPSGKDFDRPLADRGRTEAAAIGRRLAEAGFEPELALVSPARRAVETWEAAAPAFPQTRLELVRELYNATPTVIFEAAQAAGAGSVILVGHNPGLHALAFELIARGTAEQAVIRAVREGFPTAAAGVFRFEGDRAVCEAFLVPRDEDAR